VQPSDRAPGLILGEGVELADDVQLGAYVVIHPGTVVGAGCVIQDRVVLGKPPKLAAHSMASREPPPPLVLSPGAVVCAGAIVFAGASLGEGAIVGDQAFVRERAVIGPKSVVGRGSAVDNDVTIGARVRIQTDVYITAATVIEDDVFVGPGVTTTNDSTMARHPPGSPMEARCCGCACRVGGGVVVCPGVEIGEEAFIAAGAVVARDIPARGVAMGVPARVVREVPDEDLLERWR
jgi:acetyltransferase-like isoleucine patch superfamily enzyme